MKKNANPVLSADAVCASLRVALESDHDVNESMKRIKSRLTHTPNGKLYIMHNAGRVTFYEKGDDGIHYLRKRSDKLYLLAKRRYLETLLHVMEFKQNKNDSSWLLQFQKLEKLVRDYGTGNLDVARIVLSSAQYSWYIRPFPHKKIKVTDSTESLTIPYGVNVRSKSEQKIGEHLWHFAVPCHYEEQLRIFVRSLVNSLEADLRERNLLNGPLFYYENNTCFWNVTGSLESLNSPGSVWRSYNGNTGYVTIYPDYTIMLADGSLIYWEHEGLFTKFIYRTNASERIAIMRLCGNILFDDIIETLESQSTNQDVLDEIIKRKIVPRIWF